MLAAGPIGLPAPALREHGMQSSADDVLIVRGLRAGTASDDVLRVPRGGVARVRYRADVPGTYFYWATPSSRPITAWTGQGAQLAGAIIVDPEGAAPDPEERIFVITMLDQYADPDAPAAQGEYVRRAINGGRSTADVVPALTCRRARVRGVMRTGMNREATAGRPTWRATTTAQRP